MTTKIQDAKRVIQLAKQYQKFMNQPSNYNLFNVLLKNSDEVRLHSRFLADLLNPKGKHLLKNLPFQLFLEKIVGLEVIDGDYEFEVYVEHEKIDLFLVNNTTKQAVIIENKIYAIDQDQQLLRYYQTATKEGYKDISIIYLTLDGHEPDVKSVEGPLGSLKSHNQSVIRLSYKYDIEKWIKLLAEKSAHMPSLRESLFQYSQIIKELTGMSANKEYIKELKSLLIETNSVDIVKNLQEAHAELVNDVQVEFWSELISRLKKEGYNNLSNTSLKGDKNEIKERVELFLKSRSKVNEIGISIILEKYQDCFLCVNAESGERMYIGVSNDPTKTNKNIKSLIPLDGYDADDWWPLYKFIEFQGEWQWDNLSSRQIQLLHDSTFVGELCNYVIRELKGLHSLL